MAVGGDTYYHCSVCGSDWVFEEGTPKANEWNFCPHCGADMREHEAKPELPNPYANLGIPKEYFEKGSVVETQIKEFNKLINRRYSKSGLCVNEKPISLSEDKPTKG